MARLRECVDVMRALWRGEEVSHRGLVTVDRARVWSLPDEPPKLVAGAISAETARVGRRVGRRADHRQPAAGPAPPGGRRVP